MSKLKSEIQEFWSRYPCAKNLISGSAGEREFFAEHDRIIDMLTPYHKEVYQYDRFSGKRVLEIGCGMGSHARRFAEHAGEFYAVDLSPQSIEITKKRFALFNLDSKNVVMGDAENLPYPDEYFDHVYSNGVIHHSPDTQKAVMEIYRVLKPGGTVTVMIYNKDSIFYRVDLMMIGQLKYALMKILPARILSLLCNDKKTVMEIKDLLNSIDWSDIGDIVLRFSDGHFNPHTKVYTRKEAKDMFHMFDEVRTELRSSSDRFLEKNKFVDSRFGWGLFIYAKKRV